MIALDYAESVGIEVVPSTRRYLDNTAAFYIAVARERIDEWDQKADPHGYAHERSVLIGLLAEIDRLKKGASS